MRLNDFKIIEASIEPFGAIWLWGFTLQLPNLVPVTEAQSYQQRIVPSHAAIREILKWCGFLMGFEGFAMKWQHSCHHNYKVKWRGERPVRSFEHLFEMKWTLWLSMVECLSRKVGQFREIKLIETIMATAPNQANQASDCAGAVSNTSWTTRTYL